RPLGPRRWQRSGRVRNPGGQVRAVEKPWTVRSPRWFVAGVSKGIHAVGAGVPTATPRPGGPPRDAGWSGPLTATNQKSSSGSRSIRGIPIGRGGFGDAPGRASIARLASAYVMSFASARRPAIGPDLPTSHG